PRRRSTAAATSEPQRGAPSPDCAPMGASIGPTARRSMLLVIRAASARQPELGPARHDLLGQRPSGPGEGLELVALEVDGGVDADPRCPDVRVDAVVGMD